MAEKFDCDFQWKGPDISYEAVDTSLIQPRPRSTTELEQNVKKTITFKILRQDGPNQPSIGRPS